MKTIAWSSAGVTDIGLERKENQDNLFISRGQRLFVVADGMGGGRDGALASKLAVEAAEKFCQAVPVEEYSHNIERWLKELVVTANINVVSAAAPAKNSQDNGMGTTIVAMYLTDDGQAHIAHVGDSRAYLVRNSQTTILTEDHTIVREMYRRGQMTLEQCKKSQWRHLITRCLGHENNVTADLTVVSLDPGDWLLLASDGLSEGVDESEIADLINDSDSPQKACQLLVEATISAGAPDNVTVIAVKTASTR
jgi:PPM family protein phosphatase